MYDLIKQFHPTDKLHPNFNTFNKCYQHFFMKISGGIVNRSLILMHVQV